MSSNSQKAKYTALAKVPGALIGPKGIVKHLYFPCSVTTTNLSLALEVFSIQLKAFRKSSKLYI